MGCAPFEPPPMPRRPLTKRQPAPTRSAVIHVRTTAAEAEAWREKARTAGLTTSELLRQAMRETEVLSEADAEARRELTLAVARVGANVNQLARWANTHKGEADATRVLVQLAAIGRELAAIREGGQP